MTHGNIRRGPYDYAAGDPINNSDLSGTHCSGKRYNTLIVKGPKKYKRLHDHWYCGVGRAFKRFFVGLVMFVGGIALTIGAGVCVVLATRLGHPTEAIPLCGAMAIAGVWIASLGVLVWVKGYEQIPKPGSGRCEGAGRHAC